jgi:hypothetical protein
MNSAITYHLLQDLQKMKNKEELIRLPTRKKSHKPSVVIRKKTKTSRVK